MGPNDNRRPGVVSRSAGDYDSSSNSAKVIPLFPKLKTGSPFDELTAALVMERHRRGELDSAILAALLAGVGLEVPQ
jgi:hypothetical protein